jgi:hypothetical protein
MLVVKRIDVFDRKSEMRDPYAVQRSLSTVDMRVESEQLDERVRGRAAKFNQSK